MRSSDSSFFTLFRSEEAGLQEQSSGAGTGNDFSRKRISFARIHPFLRSSSVENNRHSIVNDFNEAVRCRRDKEV